MGSPRRGSTSGRLLRVVAGRVAMALPVIVLLIGCAPWLTFIEMRALDVLYLLRPAREPDPRIAVIDTGSDPSVYEHLRDPREPRGEGCEFPRLAYAEAVRRLSRWGAKVIVFDIYFSRRSEFEDERLAEAFREAANVIVAANTKTKPGAVELEEPVAPLGEAALAVGSPVALQTNETIRSIPLVVRDHDTGREYLALSLLAFQLFQGTEMGEAELGEDGWLLTAGRRVPVLSGEQISLLHLGGGSGEADASDGSDMPAVDVVRGDNVSQIPESKSWNTLLVNWVGPQGTIRPHLLSDVLEIDDDERGRELFGDKAVIIGRGDWDVWWTAVGEMPGPEIQANALQTLMSGAFIRPMSPWGMIGVLIAFILATALLVRQFKGLRAMGAIILLAAIALVIARQLLLEQRTWMYLFQSHLAIGLTWGMTAVVERGKVSALLTRFVPSFIGKPEVSAPGEVRTMDASILFSDIRGYTGISEQLSAADTLTMLNTFQSACEEIITRYGGTIVKTPGDAILAAFWQEMDGRSHATCALLSGREILEDLPVMGRAWEAAGVTLEIGIGIDAGQVAMGLVGGRHLEPTVIGDPVNVAQRLETLTKELKCPLIFSESVRERIHHDVDAQCLQEVTVRGRQMPLRVYGVGGPREGCQQTADPAEKEKTE